MVRSLAPRRRSPRGLFTGRLSTRRLAVVGATVLALVAMSGVANADQLADLEAQRVANQEEQERLSSELEGTDAALQSVYLEITRLDGDIVIAEAELATAEEELAAAERHQTSVADRLAVAETEAATLSGEIVAAQEAIASTESQIGELARSTYRGADGLSVLTVLVDASSPEEFTERATAYDVAMRSQTQVLGDLEVEAATQRNSQSRLDAVNVRIAELKVEADAAVVAADTARTNAEAYRDELADLRAERTAKAGELEGYKDQVEAQQVKIAADDAVLAGQIQEIYIAQEAERVRQAEIARVAEEQRLAEVAAQQQRDAEAAAEAQRQRDETAAQNNGGSGGTSVPPPVVQPPVVQPPPPTSSGPGLTPPVAAPFYVTSPYGMRVYPISGGRYMHNGTDIRSSCGASQYSAGPGTVVAVRGASGNGTHGNQVLIDHGVIDGNSYVTVYNHLSRFNVSAGQQIGRGDVLGYTGMTGAVTGCHVHVEVWKNGSPINPESLSGWTRTN